MAVVRTARKSGLRDYVPLGLASLMMVGLLTVLPSALNLPQTTPSETLEYAPVPPEDDDITPPPSGNLSSLGLGSSSSLGSSADFDQGAGDQLEGGAVGGRAIKTPSTKRCVGSPPRQTEDPLSPPCVASYTGDNGGKTYAGVDSDEIRVVYITFGRVCRTSSRGRECVNGTNEYVDLGKPPAEDENVYARGIRDLQNYFNDRYQTYGRRVHFWVHFGPNGSTPEQQRARAIEMIKLIDPFAIVHGINYPAFTETMARRGVLTFNSTPGTPAAYFQNYPKLIWSYLPALELQARTFSSMVCRQVVPFPAAFSGNAGENGKPRRLGLLSPHPDHWSAGHVAFGKLVKSQIEACGGKFHAEGFHPNGGQINQTDAEKQQIIEQNMASYKGAGVTTIIWPWGIDLGSESNGAARHNYFPEWILAGDTYMDGYDIGQTQNQEVFDGRAWIQTVFARSPAFHQDLCFMAMKEANPETNETDAGIVCKGFLAYEAIRQLFIGIQVAGPKLSATTIDKGYHAIPKGPSDSPFVPACYYEPGDYTCIKDGTAMYWNAEGSAPGSSAPGCWAMPEQGRRFTADTWPNREISAPARRGQDPCNGYSSLNVNVNPPPT